MTSCPNSPTGFCQLTAPCRAPCSTVFASAGNTSRRETVEDVARAAVASIGSFDRALQDYYQSRLNAALGR